MEVETNVQSFEENFEIQPIEDLQTHGVGLPDIMRLKQSGLCTMKSLYMVTKKICAKLKACQK